MKWVTRKNAHVDRIACPWLIRRFVDREAEFVFVAADQVAAVAAREGAIPFAVESVELDGSGLELRPSCVGEVLNPEKK